MAKNKAQESAEKLAKEKAGRDRLADLERREAAVAEKEAGFDAKEKSAKVTGEAKGKEELERLADEARKAEVDATNKKKVAEMAKAEAESADTPLNAEEQAFIARIAPRMNEGRKVLQPSPAEITRYSRLIKRKDVTS